MPFSSIAAGPYTATYDADGATGDPPGKGESARDLGLVESVRRWQRAFSAAPVRCSMLGDSVIDGVYQGGQCFCRMTLREWTATTRDVLWPLGSRFGQLERVGRLLSDLAGRLTLSAVDDTPAAQHGPKTLTFGKAIIDPDSVVEVDLGDTARDVPVVLRCFPYVDDEGRIVWFEETY